MATPDLSIRRILVATDLSGISSLIFAVAGTLAWRGEGRLIAFHAAPEGDYEEVRREVPMPLDDYLRQVASTLEDAVARTVGPSVPVQVEVVLEHGPIDRAILEAADRLNADLIVMGTHGRTGLRRVFLGSVAEGVLRHATRPVLVVPLAALERVEATQAREWAAAPGA